MNEYGNLVIFTIDDRLRRIIIPDGGDIFGVAGDIRVNRIMFKIPRYCADFDISEFTARINYVNPNGEANYFENTNLMTANNDVVSFVWEMEPDVTSYVGDVKFSVKLYKKEGQKVVKEFNTLAATGHVLEGFSVESAVTPEQQQTLLEKLEAEIKEDIDGYIQTVKETLTEEVKADVTKLKEGLGETETVITDMQKKMSDSNSNDGFLLCDLNGNIVGHIASIDVWNNEPYNKKYGWGGHPYGNGKLPPYSKIAGVFEADLLSVCGGKGRWNKDDTGNFQHGGHLFEGWNAEEDARLTFGIGTKNKDISWIQTFHAATQEGTDSGSYYCVTKVGSDIDNQGMNFMPSIAQSKSLFSLKVGDNLSPNSKHIQKLVETGELVDWEYNKTDMIPYGTMYFDYTKDKVRVYTRTGGWKYLKFEEEV